MKKDEPIYISLTGDNSHKVTIPAGQGSISIGTKGISEGKFDIWVDQDIPINWDAFNEFYTPAGKQRAEFHSYGNWPRIFYYSGNDFGFIKWSDKRVIEEFHWIPKKRISADLTSANIRRFFLHIEKDKIEISIGSTIHSLFLSGNLEYLDVIEYSSISSLYFTPLLSKKDNLPYQLPQHKSLKDISSIDISGSPMGPAIECRSLLQFPNTTNLNLSGNLINIDALTELEHLEGISLRFVPDLTNMPSLTSWKKLKKFIGWNIEETIGKRLSLELKELSKNRELDYSNVSQLRKKIWFTTEYGIPFSSWDNKKAKIATKAYKACLKEIKKSKTENEIRYAVVTFINVINKLPNIETSERENVGVAVSQLVESSVLAISEDLAIQWFDETRDF